MLKHWHIQTTHMHGTPDYPSGEAVYIYKTGCAKELKSTYQNKEYTLTQNHGQLEDVDCKPCKVWADYYLKQNELINGNYIYKRLEVEPIQPKGGSDV